MLEGLKTSKLPAFQPPGLLAMSYQLWANGPKPETFAGISDPGTFITATPR